MSSEPHIERTFLRPGVVGAAILLCVFAAGWVAWNRKDDVRETPHAVKDRARAATPQEIERWKRSAERHRGNDDLRAAARVYQIALQARLPDQVAIQFRHRLVEALILDGDAEAARAALDALQEGLLSDGDRIRVLVHEARLARLQGDPGRAIRFLDRALPRLGFPAEAICERGILHFDLGRLEMAVRDLKRVVSQLPNHEIAHFKLAEAYRRLKRTNDAERHLRRYREIHKSKLREFYEQPE